MSDDDEWVVAKESAILLALATATLRIRALMLESLLPFSVGPPHPDVLRVVTTVQRHARGHSVRRSAVRQKQLLGAFRVWKTDADILRGIARNHYAQVIQRRLRAHLDRYSRRRVLELKDQIQLLERRLSESTSAASHAAGAKKPNGIAKKGCRKKWRSIDLDPKGGPTENNLDVPVVLATGASGNSSAPGGVVEDETPIDVYSVLAVAFVSILGVLLLVRAIRSLGSCSVFLEEGSGSSRPTIEVVQGVQGGTCAAEGGSNQA